MTPKSIVAWTNITFQLLLPLTQPFYPAIAKMLTSEPQTLTGAVYETVPYILSAGENVYVVAKKYHITVGELRKLNQFRTFSKAFIQLGAGDEIDIPRSTPLPFKNSSNAPPYSTAPPQYKERLAHSLIKGGTLLADSDTAGAAANIARSAVVGEASDSVAHWLSQFGTARVKLGVNNDLGLDGSAVDLLVPLYDYQGSLLFSQLGMRKKDGRNTVNIGAGGRILQGDWMYGINTFFDRDITGKNNRVGLGVEAWTDYLKFSANSYLRITDWHQSRDFTDYNERPANGYDLRIEAYLPTYPQLGSKLAYEYYRGDDVALFGKDNRQKNPYAVTTGINYTPIPLITIGAENRVGKGGRNETNMSIELNYRLGASWQSQIDPSAVATSRTLAGSRYDLVERNNNIVLDYQKKELIQLSLPDHVSGSAFGIIKVDAQVTAKYGLKRIDWDTASLVAAGGEVIQISSQTLSIKLPPYKINSNVYTLSAVAYDSQGNVSKRSTTQVIVTPQDINPANSTIQASPAEIPADGVAISLLTLSLKDSSNLPVQGKSDQLTLDLNFTPDKTAAAPVSKPQLSAITETAPGVYTFQLTAGFTRGETIIAPVINDISLASAKIILIESVHALSTEYSLFKVAPTTIIADGIEASTLSFTALDINKQPIHQLVLAFEVTGISGVTVSAITEDNGVYHAELSGISAGIATVIPTLNGSPIAEKSNEIILTADYRTATIEMTMITDNAIANGVDLNKVQAHVTDKNGNSIPNVQVEFEANNDATITPTAITDANGEVTATLANINAGVTTVIASFNDNSQSIDTSFISETPVKLMIYSNGVELTTHPVVDDTLVAVAMCSIALCNGVPVNYQWEVESFVGSGVFIAIPGATSESLTITAGLQKRAIRVVSH
ncbi:ZirU family protein [Yersinia sp. 2541 StPb PI]|uniref:ZirU family protein n=1 Tax=Yersinia sp. 2541 StPb PI TaxID=3117407 RepID=UPI003FA43B7E